MALSKQLEQWKFLGKPIVFVIGGPDGIDSGLISAADQTWSLSSLTLSHHVARVVLAEQLYRAWSINQGLPYHR